jgi:hypothetical protein
MTTWVMKNSQAGSCYRPAIKEVFAIINGLRSPQPMGDDSLVNHLKQHPRIYADLTVDRVLLLRCAPGFMVTAMSITPRQVLAGSSLGK